MFFAKVAGLALAVLVPGALAQGTWQFANPKPHGNNIIDMGMNGGVVWQVGDRGSVYTSDDLDRWNRHETGVRNSLRGLAFFKGRAYISGEEGLILSGIAPGSLQAQFLDTTNWLESIAASAGELVAVGDNGLIVRSTDGQNWSPQGNFDTWLRSIAFGNGNFVCVGEDGFIATSSNGQNWTIRSGGTANLNRVAFIEDRFWVVGDGGTVLTNHSRDTFSPVNVGVTNDLYAVAGNASEILIGGDLVLLAGKPSGGPWVSQADEVLETAAPVWPYYSALWDGRLFLAGGRTGMKVEGFRTNETSPLLWFSTPQPTRNWLWSATRAGEIYAAAGAEGTIVTSTDGLDWSLEVTPPSAWEEVLLGIGGDEKALVAVGSGGVLLTSPGLVTEVVSTNSAGELETNLVSLLGVFWNEATSGTGNDLQGIASNGSTYVVTGAKGTILSSSNGTNWSSRLSTTGAYLSGVTAYPGGFVACGDGGVILNSATGLLWTHRNSGVSSWIYNVRYVGGKLIAVGQEGVILTSEDGQQWTERDSGTTEWINDVAFAAGQWVAAAGSGVLITSSDSVNWTPVKSITSRSLYGLATSGEEMIAVGLEGVILRKQLVTPLTPVNFLSYNSSGGTNLFLFGGSLGQRFSLEGSSALTSGWAELASLEILDPGGTLIHLRSVGRGRAMFFRTRLLP